MKKNTESVEIDLIKLLIDIWNGKLKIIIISFIFIILAVITFLTFKPSFIAKTEILPINIFNKNLYTPYNSIVKTYTPYNSIVKTKDDIEVIENIKFDLINDEYLLMLFLEELKKKNVIYEFIIENQLIDQKKFKNDKNYFEVIKKKAAKMKILGPYIDKKDVDINNSGFIEFEVDDKKKWEKALVNLEDTINKNVKTYLIKNFYDNIENLKKIYQFKIEDINLAIEKAKENYENETNIQLAFLKEQAQLARKLNIPSNPDIINSTFERQEYYNSSTVISNTETSNPYYLRGYEIIEKEIDLIINRTNKDAFTKDLLKLENQKSSLLKNKSLERIEILFNKTPIISSGNFKAAYIDYLNTEYQTPISLKTIILVAGMLGVVFGIFYVLSFNAIINKK